jgi:ribosome maturation factor RimP
MPIEEIMQRIEGLAKEICGAKAVDLIQVKGGGPRNSIHIQIIADKPGGITVGECSIIHKTLIAAIYRETLLTPGTFSMEVSSPGIE